MVELYPSIEPFAVHMLPVSNLHTIYVEESGNPQGIPILRIHGGPGSLSGGKERFRQLYDPDIYRIVLFDQRGCRRSQPFGELQENTTQLLLEDIEKIRVHLGIEQRVVSGGSWGSTLALAYTQMYPEYVLALLLNSLFLFTSAETDWLFNGGARNFFPRQREKYISFLPDDYTGSMRDYVTNYILENDIYDMDLIQAIILREGCGLKYIHSPIPVDEDVTDAHIASLKILCYYSKHNGFIQENSLLSKENIDRIRHIPCVILHGRYDLDCLPQNAWKLSQAFPEATLEILEGAGHRTGEPVIQTKIIERGNIFAQQLLSGNH